MKKQLLLTLICHILYFNSYSQEDRQIFYGRTLHKTTPLINAHIINLNTKQGTFTNKNGDFKIFAKKNDSLQISSIGYKTKYHLVKIFDTGLRKNDFELQKINYELDEVVLKKHNLVGSIEIDIKKTPKDRVADLMAELLNGMMNMDMSQVNMDMDQMDRMKAPIVNTNPINIFQGANLFRASLNTKNKKLFEYKKINQLKRKENLSLKIINTLGKRTFIHEFKIPEDKIYHFITYCEHKNIEELFYQHKIIDLVKVFKEESTNYLKAQQLFK